MLAFGGRPGRNTTDAMLLVVDRIKNAWRAGFNIISFILPALGEFLYLRRRSKDYKTLLNINTYGFIFGSSICYLIWTYGLIYSSLRTIQSHAYIFNSTHGIILICLNYLRKV